MAEKLILPVTELLTAVYLVPTALDGTAAKERAQAALPIHVPDPVGTVARKMLAAGAVRVVDLPASAIPPIPDELQEHLGVDPELVRMVADADGFASFTVQWPPGWPPVHEAAARACAAALAAELSAALVDTFTPRVLAPGPAITALPDASYRLALADWVLVLQSAGPHGLWMTTKGMGRFGLPELQVSNVPPQYGERWTDLLLGVAARLLDLWLDALRARGGGAFAEILGTFEFSETDVASAYNVVPHGSGGVPVRLAFDPAPDDHADSFLTIQPPDGFPASAGEYFAYACTQVLGDPGQEVRYLPRTKAMDQAIETARAALPSIRARFLEGALSPGGRLMVKHALKAPGGTEYPWAYVNSWQNPATVLANSAADAISDSRLRAGRPIVIDADTIIDWAISIAGQGIVEGGLTNTLAASDSKAQS